MGWDNVDFLKHFYFGQGQSVTLTTMGLFDQVKSHADQVSIGRFKNQIREKGKSSRSFQFSLTFENSYDFKPVVYSLGACTLKGGFNGGVCPWVLSSPPEFWIEGEMKIYFADAFTDPLSVIELLYGSSTSPTAPSWLQTAANVGGMGYQIVDSWQLSFLEERVR
jgi:hypothetical protein